MYNSINVCFPRVDENKKLLMKAKFHFVSYILLGKTTSNYIVYLGSENTIFLNKSLINNKM